MRRREYSIYDQADVILTVTDADRANILRGDPQDGNGSRPVGYFGERLIVSVVSTSRDTLSDPYLVSLSVDSRSLQCP